MLDIFVERKIQMWVVAVGNKIYLISLQRYLFIRLIGTMNELIISCLDNFYLSFQMDCSSSPEKCDINHKKELEYKVEEQVPI